MRLIAASACTAASVACFALTWLVVQNTAMKADGFMVFGHYRDAVYLLLFLAGTTFLGFGKLQTVYQRKLQT